MMCLGLDIDKKTEMVQALIEKGDAEIRIEKASIYFIR